MKKEMTDIDICLYTYLNIDSMMRKNEFQLLNRFYSHVNMKETNFKF